MFKNWFGEKKPNEPRYAKPGEFVKCIDDREHCVVFGKVYKVFNVIRTPCCNTVAYDVGLSIRNSGEPVGDDYTTCHCDDNPNYIPGRGIRWACHSRFALTDERPQEEEMTKEVENKNSNKLVKKLIEELEISLN
jgi:hypothetical protein